MQTLLSRTQQQWNFINLLHESEIPLQSIAYKNRKSIWVFVQADRSTRKADDEGENNNFRLYFGDTDERE